MQDRYGNWAFGRAWNNWVAMPIIQNLWKESAYWGNPNRTEQKPSKLSGPELVGRMVQATEESVWAYAWPRLHRTWAKIRSSVLLTTHYVHKKGDFWRRSKGPHTTCRVQRCPLGIQCTNSMTAHGKQISNQYWRDRDISQRSLTNV